MTAVTEAVGRDDHYCVFGNPVAHSKSPRIHTEFARQTGQALVYTAALVPENAFSTAVHTFREQGGRGANVTLPFKEEAWRLSTRRSRRAELAGAVNTLSFEPDSIIAGDNTDGTGLVRDLAVNLGMRLEGMDILVLGAGGAARGILPALLEAAPRQLVVANRTGARAEALAAVLCGVGAIRGGGFEIVGRQTFDLIINATSASLKGDLPPLPDRVLRAGAWCYDLMYADEPTPFLRWGGEHGAGRCADGLGMLVEQAAESFLLWRGIRPETTTLLHALRFGS